jgi:hypothetical protein
MKTRFWFVVLAGAVIFQPALAAPAPYQESAADNSCNGEKSCTLTFPTVPTGKQLTISHVSCGIVTSGESGGSAEHCPVIG